MAQDSDTATEETGATAPEREDATRKRGVRKAPSTNVAKRLKTRNGRYFLDLRDLGKGREALIPEGQTYATKDELVAIALAGKRLEHLLQPERERYFRRNDLKRTATVGEFAREWLEQARERAGEGFASARTLLRYQQAFEQAFAARDASTACALDQDTRIDRVTVSDVKRLIGVLRKTKTRSGEFTSASSIHQIITGMQLVFDHAVDEGAVPPSHNPWRELRRQDRPSLPRQSRTDFLETYEAHALLLGCEDVEFTEIPLQPLTSAYLHTGGRKAEILGLEVDDLDFRRKLVRIVSNRWRPIKDNDERSIPMWPDFERDIRRHLETGPRSTSLVFVGHGRTGEEQMITSYHKAFQRAKWAAAARLGEALGAKFLTKEINPRVFRVTYCSARLQTLDNDKPVASWTVEAEMGHDSGKMIKRVYGRIGEMRHRSAVVEYVPRDDLTSPEWKASTVDAETDEPEETPTADRRRSA